MPKIQGAPDELNNLLEKVYADAKSRGFPDERASKIAFAAARRAGWHKNREGVWVKSKEFSVTEGLFVKEADGDYYVEGFISGSTLDRGNDILTANALNFMHQQLTKENIKIGYVHQEIKGDPRVIPIGRIIESSLRDGKVHIKAILNKASKFFNEVKESIEGKFLDAFSIEYVPIKFFNRQIKDVTARVLEVIDLVGVSLTGRPMYKDGLITGFYQKEFFEFSSFKEATYDEGLFINEEEKENSMPSTKEEETMNQELETKQVLETKNTEPIAKETAVEKVKRVSKKENAENSDSVSNPELTKEFKEFLSWKEEKVRESKIAELKEVVSKIIEEKQPSISRDKPTDSPSVGIEFKEFVSSIKENKPIRAQLKSAAELVNKNPEIYRRVQNGDDYRIFTKGFATSGGYANKIEYKTLTTTTNAESTYNQASAELNDVYDPIIYSHMNDQTRFLGLLTKEDYSGRQKIQFRAETAAHTAAGYLEGASTWTATQTTRVKFEQDFAYYRVIPEVTGQMIADNAGQGGIGDILSAEMNRASIELMKQINVDLLTGTSGNTYDGTSADKLLGLQHLALNTGNLYGKARGTYASLSGQNEAMSSADVTLAQLRKMIRTVVATGNSGNVNARIEDIYFVTSYFQKDRIYAIMQSAQGIVPTSSRIGFEGMLSIDGVPVFPDPDADAEDVFLVDGKNTKLAMQVPPTLTEFGITGDTRKFFIKIYFNLYSTHPANNYHASGFSTS